MRGAQIDAEAGEIDGTEPFRPVLPAIEEAHAVEAKQALLGRDREPVDAGILDVGMDDAHRLRAIHQQKDVARPGDLADRLDVGPEPRREAHLAQRDETRAVVDGGDHVLGRELPGAGWHVADLNAEPPLQISPGKDVVGVLELAADDDIVARPPGQRRADDVQALGHVLGDGDLARAAR